MVNHEQISLFLLIISFATYVRDAGIQVRMQRVLYLRLGALFCWRMQTNCSIDLYLASFFSVFFVDLSKCAAASIVSSRSTSIPTNSCIFRPPLARPTTVCGVPLRLRQSRLGDIREAHH